MPAPSVVRPVPCVGTAPFVSTGATTTAARAPAGPRSATGRMPPTTVGEARRPRLGVEDRDGALIPNPAQRIADPCPRWRHKLGRGRPASLARTRGISTGPTSWSRPPPTTAGPPIRLGRQPSPATSPAEADSEEVPQSSGDARHRARWLRDGIDCNGGRTGRVPDHLHGALDCADLCVQVRQRSRGRTVTWDRKSGDPLGFRRLRRGRRVSAIPRRVEPDGDCVDQFLDKVELRRPMPTPARVGSSCGYLDRRRCRRCGFRHVWMYRQSGLGTKPNRGRRRPPSGMARRSLGP